MIHPDRIGHIVLKVRSLERSRKQHNVPISFTVEPDCAHSVQ